VKYALALVALVVWSFVAVEGAQADPPACPSGDDSCAALAARLDQLDADVTQVQHDVETTDTDLNAQGDRLHADMSTLDTDLNATSGAPVSGTVALSPDDATRLDLVWWGAWALVGLAFVGLIVGVWYRAWGFEGKLGPNRAG
jgi:outer membrane murein-binding lipoprotein Lpp